MTLAAEKVGKVKTVMQIASISLYLLNVAIMHDLSRIKISEGLVNWTEIIGQAAQLTLILACLLTVYSGLNYLVKYWSVFTTSNSGLIDEQPSSFSCHSRPDWHKTACPRNNGFFVWHSAFCFLHCGSRLVRPYDCGWFYPSFSSWHSLVYQSRNFARAKRPRRSYMGRVCGHTIYFSPLSPLFENAGYEETYIWLLVGFVLFRFFDVSSHGLFGLPKSFPADWESCWTISLPHLLPPWSYGQPKLFLCLFSLERSKSVM